MGNLRVTYVLLFMVIFSVGCSSEDKNSVEETIELEPSALESAHVLQFFEDPVEWILEFEEDGKPISGPNYEFSYDAQNRMTEKKIVILEGGWDFSQTWRYGYQNGLLSNLDNTSILSSDGIGWVYGEMVFNGRIVERRVFDNTQIIRYTFIDKSLGLLERFEYIDLGQSTEPYHYFEFEYSDEFLLLQCKEYRTNDVGDATLHNVFEISYDDKINPYYNAFKDYNPLIYGFFQLRQDRNSLYPLEPFLRSNMPNNVVSILRTNQISGNTYQWDYQFTYNDENLPLTKTRIIDDQTTWDEEEYNYYEIP
ncbi:MAG: hypothetical protein Aureis2KO_15870 [Aureisphaera sp.]